MKKLVLTLICSVVLATGCTQKPGCVIQDTLSNTLSPVIANGLQCSNPEAVKASIVGVIQKTGMCTQQAETVAGLPSFGQEACKFVGGLVLSQVAAQAIPAEWGCTAANAKEKLAALIAEGCTKH